MQEKVLLRFKVQVFPVHPKFDMGYRTCWNLFGLILNLTWPCLKEGFRHHVQELAESRKWINEINDHQLLIFLYNSSFWINVWVESTKNCQKPAQPPVLLFSRTTSPGPLCTVPPAAAVLRWCSSCWQPPATWTVPPAAGPRRCTSRPPRGTRRCCGSCWQPMPRWTVRIATKAKVGQLVFFWIFWGWKRYGNLKHLLGESWVK